jgi:tetratricopeptide (TPR) repeat protein
VRGRAGLRGRDGGAPGRHGAVLRPGRLVTEAAELERRFLPRARDIGDPQVVSNAFAIAAFIEQAGGDLDAALGLVAELEQATRDGPSCYRADPLPIVSRICLAAGTPELAEPFLAGADAPAARYQHCRATAGAVLAEARGDLDAAAGRYDQARTGWRGFGVVLEHAQALLGLGRCATRLGRPSARDHLDQAAELFGQLRAPGLLAETGR